MNDPRSHMLGSQPIESNTENSLTRDARNALARRVGEKRARKAIRYIIASQLTALAKSGDFDALLVAFSNNCPYCHALRQSLAETAYALMVKKGSSFIAMFETSNSANQTFAEEKLRNKYVPEFFLLHARGGRVWLEKWKNADKVRTSGGGRAGGGELRKTLPIDVLMRDLTTATAEGKSVSSETMEKYKRTERKRQLQQSSQFS